MAKKSASNAKKGRGPAREVKQTGTGGVSKTSAGKKRKRIPGSMKEAARTPGAVKGV